MQPATSSSFEWFWPGLPYRTATFQPVTLWLRLLFSNHRPLSWPFNLLAECPLQAHPRTILMVPSNSNFWATLEAPSQVQHLWALNLGCPGYSWILGEQCQYGIMWNGSQSYLPREQIIYHQNSMPCHRWVFQRVMQFRNRPFGTLPTTRVGSSNNEPRWWEIITRTRILESK